MTDQELKDRLAKARAALQEADRAEAKADAQHAVLLTQLEKAKADLAVLGVTPETAFDRLSEIDAEVVALEAKVAEAEAAFKVAIAAIAGS